MGKGLWPKRLFALDVSRAFAALAVVLWHWQHFAFEGNVLPEDYDRVSLPLYAILRIFYEKGLAGVQYFILLSGFIFFWLYRSSIENRSTTLGGFWVWRISRLYPLHFVTLIVVALLQALHVSQRGNPFVYPHNDLYHFALHLGLASSWGFESGHSFNAPVWSVSIEILLYIAFFVIAYYGKGKAFVCFSLSVISFAASIFSDHYLFMGLSLFFGGGFVYHATFAIATSRQRLKFVIYSVAALAWILTFVHFYVFDLRVLLSGSGVAGAVLLFGFPVYVLFPFTVSALVLIEIDRGQFLKSISWIGDITYSSYLLHFPLQIVFGLAVGYGYLNSDFYLNPVSLVLFFAILIPMSYVTYIAFERPVQNMIRNWHRSRPRGKQSAAT